MTDQDHSSICVSPRPERLISLQHRYPRQRFPPSANIEREETPSAKDENHRFHGHFGYSGATPKTQRRREKGLSATTGGGPHLSGSGVGAHTSHGPGSARGALIIPEALGSHHELLVAAGDDASSGLNHDFVILDPGQKIFELGGEAGSDFAAMLGD